MAELPEPAARSLDATDSGTSQPPPPRVTFDPHQLPPPPSPGLAITGQPRNGIEVRAAVVALSLAAIGWAVWLFAWLAESDTGYPDGLACTANPEASEAYASCMLSSERSGSIAWSLTLGLAVAGIVMVVRSRRGRFFKAGARALAIAAIALSGSLAIAGASSWLRGASGNYYEDRLGATAWHVSMLIAVVAGLAVGWAASRLSED